ncbi:M23 family metallopeptidase [Patescibacteria group bacterium]|nr:M23 family metallopeptidase [Patescibacteria group bacterium]
MFKRVFFTIVICLFLTSASNAEVPVLKLPYSSGETWRVTVEYGQISTHQGEDYYALDFSLPGTDDMGKPLLASASGIVTFAGKYRGYGWTADIDIGNGYKLRSAHNVLLTVKAGVYVVQGQEIGKCGASGGDWLPHVHWVLYKDGQSVKPEPMSGYTGFSEGEFYISDNTPVNVQPIAYFADGWHNDGSSESVANCFMDNGGVAIMGYPYDDGAGDRGHIYEPYDFWIWNFNYGSWGESAIVMRQDWDVAYSLHGAFWWYFWTYDVPHGLPISDEYTDPSNQQIVYQDFEAGVTYKWNLDWNDDLQNHQVEVIATSELAYEGTVTIALAPTPTLNPLDAHRIEVLIPDIMNRAYADVFCEDVFVHRMYEDKYVIEGLESSTTYHIKLMFYDGNGQFLYESDTMVAVTMAEEVSGIESISILVALY